MVILKSHTFQCMPSPTNPDETWVVSSDTNAAGRVLIIKRYDCMSSASVASHFALRLNRHFAAIAAMLPAFVVSLNVDIDRIPRE